MPACSLWASSWCLCSHGCSNSPRCPSGGHCRGRRHRAHVLSFPLGHTDLRDDAGRQALPFRPRLRRRYPGGVLFRAVFVVHGTHTEPGGPSGYREKGIGKRLIQDIISQSVAIDKVCAVLEWEVQQAGTVTVRVHRLFTREHLAGVLFGHERGCGDHGEGSEGEGTP